MPAQGQFAWGRIGSNLAVQGQFAWARLRTPAAHTQGQLAWSRMTTEPIEARGQIAWARFTAGYASGYVPARMRRPWSDLWWPVVTVLDNHTGSWT